MQIILDQTEVESAVKHYLLYTYGIGDIGHTTTVDLGATRSPAGIKAEVTVTVDESVSSCKCGLQKLVEVMTEIAETNEEATEDKKVDSAAEEEEKDQQSEPAPTKSRGRRKTASKSVKTSTEDTTAAAKAPVSEERRMMQEAIEEADAEEAAEQEATSETVKEVVAEGEVPTAEDAETPDPEPAQRPRKSLFSHLAKPE